MGRVPSPSPRCPSVTVPGGGVGGNEGSVGSVVVESTTGSVGVLVSEGRASKTISRVAVDYQNLYEASQESLQKFFI